MVNKRLLIGVGAMLLGTILVIVGLRGLPGVPVALILIGGGVGFAGYKIYETRRREIPDDLELG